MCSHGGMATPLVPVPTVLVSGMPVVTITSPYAVAGCAFVPPAGNGPCVTGMWMVGSMQVLCNGLPLAIMSGVSMCVPTATPMLPVWAQTFVIAT
jgi:uncharacterized Zn-binding protein involved in type VI secretion